MVKLGIVGTSGITEKFLKAVGYFPSIQLKAIMSPNICHVNRFIKKYHFEKGYTDFDALILDNDIDMLYIASPNSFHYLQVKKALSANIHVLCEKPITLSLHELEELENTAQHHQVFFMEAMRPVHHPHLNSIKEAMKELDGLCYAHFKFMKYSTKYDSLKNGDLPRVFSKEFGGGALNDLGVYPLTVAVLLFGKPKKIYVNAVALEGGVDLTTSVSLHYGSFVCDCTFSKVSNSYSYNEIQGEKKALLISHITHLDDLIIVDETKRNQILNINLQDDMRFELGAFLNIIDNNDNKSYQKFLSITKTVTELCDTVREKMIQG